MSQQVEWNLFGQIPPGEVVSSIEAHNSNSILVGTESGRLFRLMENRTAAELTFDHNPSHAIQGIASNGTFIACFETRGVIRGNPIPGTVPTSYLYFGLVRPRSGPLNPHGLEDFALVQVSAFARNDGASIFHSICANRSKRSKYVAFAITVDENEVWISLSSDLGNWHREVAGLPRAIRCSDVMFSEGASMTELLLSSYGRGVWSLGFH